MDTKLVKNYLYNFVNQIVVLLVPLLTAPYLARVLGPEKLGIYGYINSIYSIVTTVGLLGLNNYGVRQLSYARDDSNNRNRVYTEIMTLRFLLLLVTSIVYLIIAIRSDYVILFIIQFLLVIAVFVDCSWVFTGMEDMKIVATRNSLSKIVQLLAIFLFVKNTGDLWIYILTFPIATLIPTIYLFFPVRRYVSFCRIKLIQVGMHIVPAIKLYLPAVATTLLLQINKIMLKYFTTYDDVAFYDQAEKIITIPLTFITIVSTVMMPRLAYDFKSQNDQAIQKNLSSVMRMAMFITLPMTVGMYSISESLIPWFLGSQFLTTSLVIQCLCPLILFNVLCNISGAQYFVATDQTGILTRAYFGACFFTFVFDCILIPVMGVTGACVSIDVSMLLCCAYQYKYFVTQVKLNVQYVYHYLIGSFVMGGVILFFNYMFGSISSWWITIADVIIGSSIYGLYCYSIKDMCLISIINQVKK